MTGRSCQSRLDQERQKKHKGQYKRRRDITRAHDSRNFFVKKVHAYDTLLMLLLPSAFLSQLKPALLAINQPCILILRENNTATTLAFHPVLAFTTSYLFSSFGFVSKSHLVTVSACFLAYMLYFEVIYTHTHTYDVACKQKKSRGHNVGGSLPHSLTQ